MRDACKKGPLISVWRGAASCLACCSPAKMLVRVRAKEQFGIKPELEEKRSPRGSQVGTTALIECLRASRVLSPPVYTVENEISRDEVRDEARASCRVGEIQAREE